MPLTYANTTFPQVEGINRADIIKRFLRETGLGKTGTVDSGASASTSTILDTTRFKSSQFQPRDWQGGWIRISGNNDSSGNAPESEIKPIDRYSPNLGEFEVQPYFSANVEASDTFEVWKINPQEVLDILDEILKEDIYLPCWSLLSEVPDFDMEQSGVTNWTAITATLTKTKTNPLSGFQSLDVNVSGSDEGFDSAVLDVYPGRGYTVAALVRGATSGSITLAVRSGTDGSFSTSDTIATVTDGLPTLIMGDITTSSTTDQIRVRITSGANVDFVVDDVIVFEQGARDISLPWWVKSKQQVLGIFRLRPQSIENNLYDPVLYGERVFNFDVQDTAFGSNKLKLVARQGNINQPLFILGLRNETAFSDESTDKNIPANLINALLQKQVFDMLSQQPNSASIDRSWILERQDYWAKQSVLERTFYSERIEEILTSQSPYAEYLDPRFAYRV